MLFTEPIELAMLPSEADRKAATQHVNDHLQIRQVLISSALYAVAITLLDTAIRRSGGLLRGLTAVGLTLAAGIFTIWMHRRAKIRLLREYLRAKGYSLCMRCGYDLRGTTGERCPECGAAEWVINEDGTLTSTIKPSENENKV